MARKTLPAKLFSLQIINCQLSGNPGYGVNFWLDMILQCVRITHLGAIAAVNIQPFNILN